MDEPPVSDPSDTGTKPAATAAAFPPELPPGTRSDIPRVEGGGRRRRSRWELPKANSSMFSLPMGRAPARSVFSTQVAV